MSSDGIIVEWLGGIVKITLNRPERLNSIGEETVSDLFDAFTRIESDDGVRVVLLTGAGRGFCTGFDLFSGTTEDACEKMPDVEAMLERTVNPLIRKMRTLSPIIVCAVNGVAAGAGVSIALACDLVIAARSASFNLVFTRLGLVPDAGGSYFLPRLIGTARAMGMTLLAQPLAAQEAVNHGLIWDCVDDERLEATALALAESLALRPRQALSAAKKLIYASAGASLEEQLRREAVAQGKLAKSADFAEAVRAFREKRKPRRDGG